jgi:hypothetical protein
VERRGERRGGDKACYRAGGGGGGKFVMREGGLIAVIVAAVWQCGSGGWAGLADCLSLDPHSLKKNPQSRLHIPNATGTKKTKSQWPINSELPAPPSASVDIAFSLTQFSYFL